MGWSGGEEEDDRLRKEVKEEVDLKGEGGRAVGNDCPMSVLRKGRVTE